MCRDLKKIEKAIGKIQVGVVSTLLGVITILIERLVR